MASYKVPQDVEAEDKLIGPFSFRQFVYLAIAVVGIGLGWGLSQLFLPLAIIPLPVVLFFGALALPLRKDQPMEVYLAAVVSFYLKPRKRLWQPDGIQSLVEITAPKEVEVERSKNLTQDEAQQRLSYLANIVDTGGWAVRGVESPTSNAMRGDAYFEAQQAQDVLDDRGGVARSFDTRLNEADVRRREEMMQRMHEQPQMQPSAQPAPPVADPYATLQPPATNDQPIDEPKVTYNPYPSSIHQSMIQPLGQQPQEAATPLPLPQPVPQKAAAPTSEKQVSPDIINLANNPDLSVETIAREAKRIQQKQEQSLPEDEVVISLR
jgi:hypothetical protein